MEHSRPSANVRSSSPSQRFEDNIILWWAEYLIGSADTKDRNQHGGRCTQQVLAAKSVKGRHWMSQTRDGHESCAEDLSNLGAQFQDACTRGPAVSEPNTMLFQMMSLKDRPTSLAEAQEPVATVETTLTKQRTSKAALSEVSSFELVDAEIGHSFGRK